MFTYEDTQTGQSHWTMASKLLLWTVINVAPIWYTIYSNRRSKYDPKRDKDFKPFVRLDYNKWSYWKAILTHFFFITRFLIGWCAFFATSSLAILLCIGQDTKNLSNWRKQLITKFSVFTSFTICILSGVYPKRKRVQADYRKYLGPDWKQTYDGAGIHIC